VPKRYLSLLLVLAFAYPAAAQVQQVVPNDRETVAGTTGFLGPLSNAFRKYQLLIHESQLTDLVGQPLTSITWRLLPAATADWPAANVTFSDYSIFVGRSVDPALRSLTFDANADGPQTQVRSGALEIPAGSFQADIVPRSFGMEVSFDTPYVYSGDHLLIELRHTGFSGTSASVDAAGTAASTGYGTLFSAVWSSSHGAITGSQGNFAITQITAVPEPGTITAAIGGLALLTLRRRR
jgi:uncharacterized protein RhaS with RHS repeats